MGRVKKQLTARKTTAEINKSLGYIAFGYIAGLVDQTCVRNRMLAKKPPTQRMRKRNTTMTQCKMQKETKLSCGKTIAKTKRASGKTATIACRHFQSNSIKRAKKSQTDTLALRRYQSTSIKFYA